MGLFPFIRRLLAERPTGFWFALFVFLNLAFGLDMGNGARSRFASLAALVEDGSFSINAYRDTTDEWARGAGGRIYSDKAPGPTLLGLPFYWVMDRFTTSSGTSRAERDEARWAAAPAALRVLSFLLQVVPFFLLTGLLMRWLRERDCSPGARHLAVLLMLLGNGGALLLHDYYGSGLASVFLLGLMIAWVRRRPFWVGLCFGAAALCDYGLVLLLIPLGVLLYVERGQLDLADVAFFLGGLALPAAVWAVYHGVIFGGAFRLPLPVRMPEPRVFLRLLGTNLWLGPLILALCLLWRRHTPWADPNARLRTSLGVLGLGLLVLMVFAAETFDPHHGGPRSFAALLPLFGPVAALAYDRVSPLIQGLLWMGVGATVARNLNALLAFPLSGDLSRLVPFGLGVLGLLVLLSRLWRREALVRDL